VAKKKHVWKLILWELSPPVEKLLKKLDSLSEAHQREFVDSLRDSLVWNHPCIKRHRDNDDEVIRETVTELGETKKKVIRNPGKPERNAEILRLHHAGKKPIAIGRTESVKALNNGKAMTRQAVENIIKAKPQ